MFGIFQPYLKHTISLNSCLFRLPQRRGPPITPTSPESDVSIIRQIPCLSEHWDVGLMSCSLVRHALNVELLTQVTHPTSHLSDNLFFTGSPKGRGQGPPSLFKLQSPTFSPHPSHTHVRIGLLYKECVLVFTKLRVGN